MVSTSADFLKGKRLGTYEALTRCEERAREAQTLRRLRTQSAWFLVVLMRARAATSSSRNASHARRWAIAEGVS